MNASIDLGNTQGKIGLFEGDRLVELFTFKEDEEGLSFLNEKQPKLLIVSNVGRKRQGSFFDALAIDFQVITLDSQTLLPITNSYKTPETLGMDRLAAVIGGQPFFPQQACLVIDMGTCITYDFITEKAEYLGGGISPGVWLRARAMHEFTANLPMIPNISSTPLVGQTTEECLKSGVVNGVTAEIEQIIAQYQARFGIFNTVLCGGDANFFESQLKAHIFVRQEVVLIGLNTVLQYLITTSQIR